MNIYIKNTTLTIKIKVTNDIIVLLLLTKILYNEILYENKNRNY